MFIGENVLKLNSGTMVNIVQEYIDKHFPEMKAKVQSITPSSNGLGSTYDVNILPSDQELTTDADRRQGL